VLQTIRKTGSYSMPATSKDILTQLVEQNKQLLENHKKNRVSHECIRNTFGSVLPFSFLPNVLLVYETRWKVINKNVY
jgi:hypothetical protein